MYVAIVREKLTGDIVEVVGPYDSACAADQSCEVLIRDQLGFDNLTFLIVEVRDPTYIAPFANSIAKAEGRQ